MIRFLVGFAAVHGLAVALAVDTASRNRAGWLPVGFIMLVAPTLAAWLACEGVHAVRPRALFVGRTRSSLLLVSHGAVAGLSGILVAAVGFAFLDQWLADGLVMTAAATCAATSTVLLLPRWRLGRCVYCGYDQRGTTTVSDGRCTECGATPDVPALS